MKTLKTIVTAIFIMAILISCSKTKEELIIGKWKVDFHQYDKEKNKLTEDQLVEYNRIVAIFEYTTFEFFKDKTFQLSTLKDGEKVTKGGKYQFLNDGKNLELTSKAEFGRDKVQQNGIIEITPDAMKLVVKKDTVFYKRVKE